MRYAVFTVAEFDTDINTETETILQDRDQDMDNELGSTVLCRTFHTEPKQVQGLTPIVHHCSGSGPGPCPGTGHSECDYTISKWRKDLPGYWD